MSERGICVVFIAGLILVMGGVGGVENSMTNEELLSSLTVCVLGMLSMYAAVLGIRQLER